MDQQTFRYLIFSLTIICALAVGGVVITAAAGREPPAVLGTIAGTTIGTLCGILVPTPWGTRRNGHDVNRAPNGKDSGT